MATHNNNNSKTQRCTVCDKEFTLLADNASSKDKCSHFDEVCPDCLQRSVETAFSLDDRVMAVAVTRVNKVPEDSDLVEGPAAVWFRNESKEDEFYYSDLEEAELWDSTVNPAASSEEEEDTDDDESNGGGFIQ